MIRRPTFRVPETLVEAWRRWFRAARRRVRAASKTPIQRIPEKRQSDRKGC